jgi:hypothetical protein
MPISPPAREEYPDFFVNYVGKISEVDVLPKLEQQLEEILDFFPQIPKEKRTFRYAPGKWDLHEMLGHIIDTERIFATRALCIARGEAQTLPPFDENDYARESNAARRSFEDLVQELLAVRLSNVFLFKGMEPPLLDRWGTVGSYRITVRALAYGMAGHLEHHFRLIREKYL